MPPYFVSISRDNLQLWQLAASFKSELSTDSRATQFRFLNALFGQAPIIWQLPDNQNAYRNDFSGQYKSAGFLSPDRAVNCNQTWHLIKRLRLRCKSRQRHLECLQGGFLATQLPSSNPAIYLFRRLTGFPSDTFFWPIKAPFLPWVALQCTVLLILMTFLSSCPTKWLF